MSSEFKKEIEEQLNTGNISLNFKFGKFIAWTQVLILKKNLINE